jgi:hypothetical protein
VLSSALHKTGRIAHSHFLRTTDFDGLLMCDATACCDVDSGRALLGGTQGERVGSVAIVEGEDKATTKYMVNAHVVLWQLGMSSVSEPEAVDYGYCTPNRSRARSLPVGVSDSHSRFTMTLGKCCRSRRFDSPDQ